MVPRDDHDGLHAEPCGGGSGLRGLVGLGIGPVEQAVAVPVEGWTQRVGELAGLVAAHGQSGHVIAFDENSGTPKGFPEARTVL